MLGSDVVGEFEQPTEHVLHISDDPRQAKTLCHLDEYLILGALAHRQADPLERPQAAKVGDEMLHNGPIADKLQRLAVQSGALRATSQTSPHVIHSRSSGMIFSFSPMLRFTTRPTRSRTSKIGRSVSTRLYAKASRVRRSPSWRVRPATICFLCPFR